MISSLIFGTGLLLPIRAYSKVETPAPKACTGVILCRGAAIPNLVWISVRANRNGIRMTVRLTHRTGSGESYC
jgi:hypothetical protein